MVGGAVVGAIVGLPVVGAGERVGRDALDAASTCACADEITAAINGARRVLRPAGQRFFAFCSADRLNRGRGDGRTLLHGRGGYILDDALGAGPISADKTLTADRGAIAFRIRPTGL